MWFLQADSEARQMGEISKEAGSEYLAIAIRRTIQALKKYGLIDDDFKLTDAGRMAYGD
jgi:hypothetical protein